MTTSITKSNVPAQVLPLAAMTEQQAKAIFEQGQDAVVFALLELTKQLAEAHSPSITPSTPSGMIPVYKKPAKKKRGKKPGAKNGHPGSRRKTPEKIDKQEKHQADICPRLRRLFEALPRNTHAIHRRYTRDRTGSNRTYYSSRLVFFMSQKSGTCCCRCVTGINTRAASAGADCLVALRAWQHVVANWSKFSTIIYK